MNFECLQYKWQQQERKQFTGQWLANNEFTTNSFPYDKQWHVTKYHSQSHNAQCAVHTTQTEIFMPPTHTCKTQNQNNTYQQAHLETSRRSKVTKAVLSYSVRGYDSAVCCSKMSCDAFLSEALYEADKALEKIAIAPRECACLQDRRRWIANVCFILLL